MPADFIYLASGSPRRRELLQQIGVAFRVMPSAMWTKLRLPGEAPLDYVIALGRGKGYDAGWARSREPGDAPVLAADTAVVLDGQILGKPRDRDDANDHAAPALRPHP